MGRRFEETDLDGQTVWHQDGFEVFQDGERFKVRDSTRGLHAWLPGTFDSVDEAFMAARILKEADE